MIQMILGNMALWRATNRFPDLNCLLLWPLPYTRPCCLHPAALIIISDNKAVVDGFAKGPRLPDSPSHSNMGDLWERFWAIYAVAKGAGWTFTVQKIKSHTLEQDFNEYPLDLDDMPLEHRIGNSRADRWADYAASLVQCGTTGCWRMAYPQKVHMHLSTFPHQSS